MLIKKTAIDIELFILLCGFFSNYLGPDVDQYDIIVTKTMRWPRFSRQQLPIYNWTHAPSVMPPTIVAAFQNILGQASFRRGRNAGDDHYKT
jgi:hypothetical protein